MFTKRPDLVDSNIYDYINQGVLTTEISCSVMPEILEDLKTSETEKYIPIFAREAHFELVRNVGDNEDVLLMKKTLGNDLKVAMDVIAFERIPWIYFMPFNLTHLNLK